MIKMMSKKFLLASLFFACAVSNVAKAVTLEESLVKAYDYHDDMKAIREDFLIEVEAFPSALAAFLPRIYAGIATSDSKTSQKDTAGNVTVARDSSGNVLDTSGIQRSLTIEQSLFNGGADLAMLKYAQSAVRSARAKYYSSEQEAILNQINAYLSLASSKEKYAISDISVTSNKKQFEATQEKMRLGEATTTEVSYAEAALATAESSKLRFYAEYVAAKNNFIRIFGIEGEGVVLPEVFPKIKFATLDELITNAMAYSPVMETSKNTLSAAKSIEYSRKAALLPSVSAKVSQAESTPKFPGRGAPSASPRAKSSHSTEATLSMTIPILIKGGAEYSEIRKAKHNKRKAFIDLDSKTKQLEMECRTRWEEFNAVQARLNSSNKAVAAAEIAYEGTKQESALGSKTIIDVLIAEEKLNHAREQVVDAKKDLAIVIYRIKSLTGDLTAKAMKLAVQYFEPENEFKKAKLKIVGF
jgi:outer membrane protein